jgi:hypothetical protein
MQFATRYDAAELLMLAASVLFVITVAFML